MQRNAGRYERHRLRLSVATCGGILESSQERTMSALTRFDPLNELFADPFPDMFRRFIRSPDRAGARVPNEMKVDVTESEQQYVVRAEIPGAKKEDVRVTIDGNFVSISAEVKEEKERKGERRARRPVRELYQGSLARGFSLGHEVNDKEAQAKFDSGVLTLTLPKRAEAKGTTLKIS